MRIFNAHAHIYPDKIAEKATDAIGKFYDIPMQRHGTPAELIKSGSEAGISKYVVHSCATKETQVRSINEFIKAEMDKYPEFIGFMTLHQDMTEKAVAEELTWCLNNGFKGIKLHPDFQKFYIDDPIMDKVYGAVGEIGKDFPILFHTGDNRYEFSKPIRLAAVAKKFPKVKFIGAHFGGYRCWDQVDCYKGLENVFFDTSSSLAFIGEKKAKELIDMLGSEKFFFGDDFPMWNAKEELERFYKIDLTEKQREKILSTNLANLLNI